MKGDFDDELLNILDREVLKDLVEAQYRYNLFVERERLLSIEQDWLKPIPNFVKFLIYWTLFWTTFLLFLKPILS